MSGLGEVQKGFGITVNNEKQPKGIKKQAVPLGEWDFHGGRVDSKDDPFGKHDCIEDNPSELPQQPKLDVQRDENGVPLTIHGEFIIIIKP